MVVSATVARVVVARAGLRWRCASIAVRALRRNRFNLVPVVMSVVVTWVW